MLCHSLTYRAGDWPSGRIARTFFRAQKRGAIAAQCTKVRQGRRMRNVEVVSEWLASATSAIAFTGAGISTESGIPDFRSPGGVWSRNQPVMYDEFVRSRDARVRYWRQRREMYPDFAKAQPNDGHRALAELEQRGRLVAVITQNIDGLHQVAGSRRVIELHGTTRIVACISCGKEWSPDEVHAWIDAGNEAPDCDACGGPLKSKTISFGQAMPIAEMAEGERLAKRSDVCLAIGSSLVVEPAASIPRVAKYSGSKLVIINHAPTPLDSIADVIIRESIGSTLRSVVDCVVAMARPELRSPAPGAMDGGTAGSRAISGG